MTVPENVEQEARPFWLIVIPPGMGMPENGLPIDHRTCGMADMGAMLKFPIAVNCTCLEVFCAVAAAGVTVMLWSCREGVEVILLPPHAVRQRKRGEIKKEAKRNFTSASQKL